MKKQILATTLFLLLTFTVVNNTFATSLSDLLAEDEMPEIELETTVTDTEIEDTVLLDDTEITEDVLVDTEVNTAENIETTTISEDTQADEPVMNTTNRNTDTVTEPEELPKSGPEFILLILGFAVILSLVYNLKKELNNK